MTNKIKALLCLIRAKKNWWQLFLYLAIMVFITPSVFTLNSKALYIIYALAIYLIVVFIIDLHKQVGLAAINPCELGFYKFFICLLLFSIMLLLLTRLIPFIRYGETPLGYDTGFYLRDFRGFHDTTKVYGPFYLILMPLVNAGMSALATLNFVYILSQGLIAGSLYFFFRSLKIKNSFTFAVIAVFLFVVSITQFQAYWWMLAQQLLSMSLLILSIAFIFRNSLLFILTGAAGLMIHPPTFIILFFSMFIVFLFCLARSIINRQAVDKKILFTAIVGTVACGIFIYIRFDYFYSIFQTYIIQYKGLATNALPYEIPKLLGSFIRTAAYQLNNYLLFPFALIGILHVRLWKAFFPKQNHLALLIYAALVGLLILTIFPFIYQQRFLIIFDILLLIFATPIILILMKHFTNDRTGKVIFMVFLIFFCVRLGFFVYNQKPQLTDAEFNEIKATVQKIAPHSIILTTNSLYAPWLSGFSQSYVISPGFNGDQWNLSEWIKFWNGHDDTLRYELLNELQRAYESYHFDALYVFIGDRENRGLPYEKFIKDKNPKFLKISPHFWQYQSTL